ncbi:hypothetical protein SK128_018143, partial [Halocaridina rubra]
NGWPPLGSCDPGVKPCEINQHKLPRVQPLDSHHEAGYPINRWPDPPHRVSPAN